MSDVVERLRNAIPKVRDGLCGFEFVDISEAADEIERLRELLVDAKETLNGACIFMQKVHPIIGVIKSEWEPDGHWSSYDESVINSRAPTNMRAHEMIARIDAALKGNQ